MFKILFLFSILFKVSASFLQDELQHFSYSASSLQDEGIKKVEVASLQAILQAVKDLSGDMVSIKAEIKDLRSEINDVKADINEVKTSMTSNVMSLRSDMSSVNSSVQLYSDFVFYPPSSVEHIAMKYYQKYGLEFVGFGYRKSGGDSEEKDDVSLGDCLEFCQFVRYKRGVVWNGLHYRVSSGKCICEKNEVGHIDDEEYLHYKFV